MRTLTLCLTLFASSALAQLSLAAPPMPSRYALMASPWDWKPWTGQVAGMCGSGRWCYSSKYFPADGTAAAPAYAFFRDTDTGFYRRGTNEIGIASGGSAWGYFSTALGTLVGPSANSAMTIDADNARLTFNTSYVDLTTGVIDLTTASGYIYANGSLARTTASRGVTVEDAEGLEMVGVAQASFSATTQASIQRDTGRNGFWRSPGSASLGAASPWVNLAGGPHPVLEKKIYTVEMGQESTATPTWQVAPRLGAGALTITIVDAAAAVSGVIGASPHLIDARGSVTAAAIGSISSGIASSAWVRLDHGPRFCQKVIPDLKTSIRVWLGLTVALPGASDTNANQNVSFRFSTAASDANWQACSYDGATQSCTDTGVSMTNGTGSFHLLCIDCYEGTACVYSVDGIPRVRKTTNLPTVSTKLANYWSVEARAASARTLYAGVQTVETD